MQSQVYCLIVSVADSESLIAVCNVRLIHESYITVFRKEVIGSPEEGRLKYPI